MGGPANLVVNDLREKRSWVEKRFTLTLFTGFTAFTGHSLGIHSSFALVARPRQLLALSTGVGCCLGDLNFITVDLLPGVVARQRSDDVHVSGAGVDAGGGVGCCTRVQAKQIEIEVCADWF